MGTESNANPGTDIVLHPAVPVDRAAVILGKLREPFDPLYLKVKPQAVRGASALAIAYIDARTVQDRLDEVLGLEGWTDEYTLLPDNSAVICKLTLTIDGRAITKIDVGSFSDQADEGDKIKAGFSDAFKRAAVKFGIGRYIYRLPQWWLKWDAQKKQFAEYPQLPNWALPESYGNTKAPQLGQAATEPTAAPMSAPKSGKEFLDRLKKYEAATKKFKAGELVRWVQDVTKLAGYPVEFEKWDPDALTHGSLLAEGIKKTVQEGGKLPRPDSVSEQLAGEFETEFVAVGKEKKGRLFGKWLDENGIPALAELAKVDYAHLVRLRREFEKDLAEEEKERKAIQETETKAPEAKPEGNAETVPT